MTTQYTTATQPTDAAEQMFSICIKAGDPNNDVLQSVVDAIAGNGYKEAVQDPFTYQDHGLIELTFFK